MRFQFGWNHLTEVIQINIQRYILWENKARPFLHIILLIKDSLQQQSHFMATSLGTNAVVGMMVHYICITSNIHTIQELVAWFVVVFFIYFINSSSSCRNIHHNLFITLSQGSLAKP